MSNYAPRYSTHHLRQPSASAASANPAQHSPALVARINEKKQELENLLALKDLSAALAAQMHQLEEKLATLADGTEAVAAVLSNWTTVLQAIAMASSKRAGGLPFLVGFSALLEVNFRKTLRYAHGCTAKIPKPKSDAEDDPFTVSLDKDELDGFPTNENGVSMPQTLVRIPVDEK